MNPDIHAVLEGRSEGCIVCADSLAVMRDMPDGCVDLVATDPPYGVEYEGGHLNERQRERLIGDDGDVYTWAIPTCFRVCSGPCYIFFAGTKSRWIFDAIANARGVVHCMLIWNKTNATYAAMNAQYKYRHEPFLYCKGRNARTRWIGPTNECTVWDIPRDPINDLHPTQKPIAIMERMIRNHDADIILDPFCGSGTTCVAAKKLGRRYIGIDISEDYCEIARQRLLAVETGVPMKERQSGQAGLFDEDAQ